MKSGVGFSKRRPEKPGDADGPPRDTRRRSKAPHSKSLLCVPLNQERTAPALHATSASGGHSFSHPPEGRLCHITITQGRHSREGGNPETLNILASIDYPRP